MILYPPSAERLIVVTGAHKRNWKVVWCVEVVPPRGVYTGEFQMRRCVAGQRNAREAWALFWRLRGQPWVAFGPELYRGRKKVL